MWRRQRSGDTRAQQQWTQKPGGTAREITEESLGRGLHSRSLKQDEKEGAATLRESAALKRVTERHETAQKELQAGR